eukprot:scaffold93676_cov21-Phaeocystis_antarctica.AAC.1
MRLGPSPPWGGVSLFAAPPGAERPRPGCGLGRSTEEFAPTSRCVQTAGGPGQWTHPKECVLCTVQCVHIHCWGGQWTHPKGCAHTTLLGVSHRGELATKVRYFGGKSTNVPRGQRWAPNLLKCGPPPLVADQSD